MVLLGKRSQGSETCRENKLRRAELLSGPLCEDDETSYRTPSKGQQESLFLENPEVLLTLSLGIFLEEKVICIWMYSSSGTLHPKRSLRGPSMEKQKNEIDNSPWKQRGPLVAINCKINKSNWSILDLRTTLFLSDLYPLSTRTFNAPSMWTGTKEIFCCWQNSNNSLERLYNAGACKEPWL